MKSENEKQNKMYAFDCYCKRVIKNEMRKFYNELNRQKSREILFCDLTGQERKQLCAYDFYFETEHTFIVLEYRISLCDNCLAVALKELPEQKRNIILLYYFIGLNDSEVGKRLSMIRATVQYNRKRGLMLLKQYIRSIQDEP